MSKRAKRKKYSREKHGPMLVAFMSAWDHDDLADGAWQAVLESGGESFAKAYGISISGFDAFMEYVMLNDKGEAP